MCSYASGRIDPEGSGPAIRAIQFDSGSFMSSRSTLVA
jgi:hypothetical protein